jgi:hypothetical protein
MRVLLSFLMLCACIVRVQAAETVPPYLVGQWDGTESLKVTNFLDIHSDGRCGHYQGNSADVMGWPKHVRYLAGTQTLLVDDLQLRYDVKLRVLRGGGRIWKRKSPHVYNEKFPSREKRPAAPPPKRLPKNLPLMTR